MSAVQVGATSARRRVRARVTGTVQGVGFRPFVYRLAAALDLAGYVLNDEHGVLVEVEGSSAAVDVFLELLASEAPPLAAVEEVLVSDELALGGEDGFAIVSSERGGTPDALVSPDTATCADCLRQLFDPDDRRYRYAFINCTNCGPRFTIVQDVPYDRPLTTMRSFEMCDRCRDEYEDPADRRFHAQPNACPECGPGLRLADAAGRRMNVDDPLRAAARALLDGRVVAVKGLGGYHLACVAADERAVSTLRSRKHRESKPFALMARDLAQARRLARLEPADEELLESRARPIVLAPRRPGAPVAPAVAPGLADLGVMLPYSPLHHLLLAEVGEPLVMTSGNVSDEPIAYRDDDALERLRNIADLFLLHDRPIHMRTDDSVLRTVPRRPALVLRRSRGYVPASIELPLQGPPVLACGAELKSTFCITKGPRAWVSHHIGDLKNWETLRSFQEGVEHFERLFAVEPRAVAHDLHPDYLSTRYALERDGVEHVGVQHHHAHLAACLAEHGETGPAVGAIYDGAGLGDDGTVWGGELLVGDLADFERAGHLRPVRLPGGDRAALEAWRMACAWLAEAYDEAEPQLPRQLCGLVAPERWTAVARLTRAPLTSSIGRLFDGAAALLGLRTEVHYEGQAAAELEALADPRERASYPLPLDGFVLDARETIRALADDVSGGVEPAAVAARFHNALAAGTARACEAIAEARRLSVVVLSGGVFQNRRLVERTAELLEVAGLRVLLPTRLPPGDGGLSYGQAAVAAARLSGRGGR